MSYHNAIDYLETKTKVLELCNEYGARVAVCPDWNGRVMTSSADGLDGDSFGMINVPGIERGDDDDSYRFLGGEDQFTLSPEGGPFSLYFAFDPEASAVRKCQVAPPIGYHEGRFDVDFAPPTPSIRMRRNLRMMNLAGARFDFDIVRTVRLTDDADFCPLYGEAVASALEQQDLSYVSYQTVNTLVNRGGTLSKNSGLVSIRLRSMFNSTPHHVIVVPFKPGSEEELGPSVCVDFFGMAPHGRLRVLDNIALLRADGRYRCQIGVSRKRSLPCIGAIDLRNGVLSLVSFEMPPDPAGYDYLSNEYCETVSHTTCDFVRTREFYFSEFLPSPREEPPILELAPEDNPYSGEVLRAYSSGPSGPEDRPGGAYYEFNTFSPAYALNTNESFSHVQYTTHINADRETLEFLLRSLFHADLDFVYKRMLR